MNCTHPKYTSHRCPLQTLEILEARICVTKSPLPTVIYSLLPKFISFLEEHDISLGRELMI